MGGTLTFFFEVFRCTKTYSEMKIEDKLDLSLGDLIKAENKSKKKKKKQSAKKKKPQKQSKKKKKKKPEQKKKLAKPGFIRHVAELQERMQEVSRKPKGVHETAQQKARRLKRAAKARKTYLDAKKILKKKRTE